MNVTDYTIIAALAGNGGGGGGQPSGGLVLIHCDADNVLDKSYNEIREMLRGGKIPYAVTVPDDNWVGVYVFMEASYNDDPYDPMYLAGSLYLDGGNPSTAVFSATDPDTPLAN